MQKNWRVQAPITLEAKAMLQTYADASGKSLAAVCSEILEQTAPVMLDMSKAMEQAKSAPAKAMRMINKTLEEQLASLDQHQLDLEPKETKKKA